MKLTTRNREKLGARLKQLRERHKLTQAQLAKALGYSCNQYISNVECGKCEPTLKIIKHAVKTYSLGPVFYAYLGKLYAQSMKEQVNGKN